MVLEVKIWDTFKVFFKLSELCRYLTNFDSVWFHLLLPSMRWLETFESKGGSISQNLGHLKFFFLTMVTI